MAVVEHDGAPLVISGGGDGALRSWRLDGSLGPLDRADAHDGAIRALAVLEHDGAPLVISAGDDGALHSWRVAPSLRALASPLAQKIKVRELSTGSLDAVLQLPPEVLAATASAMTAAGVAVAKLDKIVDVIERLAGFPATLRGRRIQAHVEELRAQADLLDAQEQLAAKRREIDARGRSYQRQLQAAGWEITNVVVSDDDDDAVL